MPLKTMQEIPKVSVSERLELEPQECTILQTALDREAERVGMQIAIRLTVYNHGEPLKVLIMSSKDVEVQGEQEGFTAQLRERIVNIINWIKAAKTEKGRSWSERDKVAFAINNNIKDALRTATQSANKSPGTGIHFQLVLGAQAVQAEEFPKTSYPVNTFGREGLLLAS